MAILIMHFSDGLEVNTQTPIRERESVEELIEEPQLSVEEEEECEAFFFRALADEVTN
jgi:hypothetical protein